MTEPRAPVSPLPDPYHDVASHVHLSVAKLLHITHRNGRPITMSGHAANATERMPPSEAGSPAASPGHQKEHRSIELLRWSIAAVLASPFLFLLASRAVLPCWIAVSHAAWTQAERTEIRVPFSITTIDHLPDLDTVVEKGDLLCRISNALPDMSELRELTQQQANLRASLKDLGEQLNAVELQLGETSDSWKACVGYGQQSLAAAVKRASAELAAARADHENAVETHRMNERMGTAVSTMERNGSRLRVELASQRIKALEVDSRRLATEGDALRSGLPLATMPDLPARKAGLELRCVELRARQGETELRLAAVDARLQAAQEALDTRTTKDLYAPCDGRITWINAATVVSANEPLIRISQRASLIDALFTKTNADRVFPGQPVVVAFSTGEESTGRIQEFVEPAASLPSRTMEVPRQADQVRVLIRLDATSTPPALLAGMPVSVAVCDWSSVGILMSNRLSRWMLYAAVWLTLFVLAIKAVLSQVRRPAIAVTKRG